MEAEMNIVGVLKCWQEQCEFWIWDTGRLLWQHKLATAKHWVWVCVWKV